MAARLACMLVLLGVVFGDPLYAEYDVHKFNAGIKYDKSIPMGAGADRFRHRGVTEPFAVSISTTAKNNFVIDYLDVTATTDADAEVTFCIMQGEPGSKSMVFQITSNGSDFLQYSYLAYGLSADEYAKVTANSAGRPFC